MTPNHTVLLYSSQRSAGEEVLTDFSHDGLSSMYAKYARSCLDVKPRRVPKRNL